MKKLMGLFLIMLLSFAITGCAPSENGNNEITEEPTKETQITESTEPTKETEETKATEEKLQTEKVKLYFVNREYIETGDESLEKLVPETIEVEIGNKSIEEVIVSQLMKGSENNELDTLIPSSVKLISVVNINGKVYVDFAQEGLSGSSMQETFTIDQIVASLLEIEGVNEVQFLVEGKVQESLMGHVSVEEPFDGVSVQAPIE